MYQAEQLRGAALRARRRGNKTHPVVPRTKLIVLALLSDALQTFVICGGARQYEAHGFVNASSSLSLGGAPWCITRHTDFSALSSADPFVGRLLAGVAVGETVISRTPPLHPYRNTC